VKLTFTYERNNDRQKWEFWVLLVLLSIYKWTQYFAIQMTLVIIIEDINWVSNVTQKLNIHHDVQEGMIDKCWNFGTFVN
jgi:hypothetical protein